MNTLISSIREQFNQILHRFKGKSQVAYDDEGIPLTPEEPTAEGSSTFSKKSTSLKTLPTFDWERIFQTIFSPKSRPFIHQLFAVVMILTTMFAIGKIVGLNLNEMIKPTQIVKKNKPIEVPQQNTYGELTSIAKANLFNTRQIDPATGVAMKRIQKNVVCQKSDLETALPIKLLNTIVLQDSVKSLAAVSVKSGPEPVEIHEGDRLEGMIQVGKIERLRMIFRNLTSGDCEYSQTADAGKELYNEISKMRILTPEQGSKLLSPAKKLDGVDNDGNSYQISKKLRDKLLLDTSSLLSQAKGIQLKNPDGSLSFKITEIVPGSIYSHLNIQDGDVITAIDGKPIKNMNEILNLFGRIKSVDHLQLSVQRNAGEQVMDYNFR